MLERLNRYNLYYYLILNIKGDLSETNDTNASVIINSLALRNILDNLRMKVKNLTDHGGLKMNNTLDNPCLR